ncbi:MAG TPA: hypothetical protein VKU00_05350 [Chthonomonadaceae bacterium]|nr:hypothetical protein [Chthonomonadaceae bacterium]
MKITPAHIGALSACFAFGLLAAQTVRADDSPVLLQHTVKTKDLARYKIVIKAEVPAVGSATLTIIRKDEVKEVKDNGDTSTLVTPEKMTLNLAGDESDRDTPPPFTLVRTKVGKLLDYKPEKEDESILTTPMWKLFNALSEPLLAAKEVKPNDTWETEFDNPLVDGKKFTLKSVYLGTEKVDGVDLWKIKQTATPVVDKDGGKMPFEQTSWLDPASGQIVKAEATYTDIPTNTQFGKVGMSIKVTPVKDEKKPDEKKSDEKKDPSKEEKKP